ncbi:MAG: nucleotidyltransferase family protein [Myxococcota bacterium]
MLPRTGKPAQRWLAHLLRACEGSIRPGDPFDDLDPFEPRAVLRAAERARVAPLLHRALEAGRIADPLPSSFRSACERIYYASLRKNLIALETSASLFEELAAAGIPAAPLKGWAFVTGSDPLYPDCGTRPMDDLDLIVDPAHREPAFALLESRGFRPVNDSAARVAGGHEVAFHRRVSGADLFVELHWAWAGKESLMREFAVSGADFLGSLCEESDDGTRRQTELGAILFTSLHATRHTLERWIWLVDLHRLLTRREPDWEGLLREAARWRVRRPLYAAFAATRELLRTPIPKEVLSELAPGPVRKRLLHRSLARTAQEPRHQRRAWTVKLLLGESWWDVARTAAWAASPGEAWFSEPGRRPDAHPLHAWRSRPGGDA